ncbi:MAG: hypothetical protein A2W01_01625 [Candidatus Solincola sediminis]|uniref:UPF0182 protein A2Y75_07685 n=1 Tax=Candidatus Solincola sediminis TaxID=1797199 RepID=A0A1F2WKD4_9ACTN|nr:MAG: hypothetical protein A2Y75_07685 [Candidatus Solincola sediminis]OFW58842.1 MAG: hypothetical protein A2W01_01625 [Candidatus Solincola sediminis]
MVGIIIIVLIVLILSASWLSTFYTDYLWFKEVGYTSVFWKVIWTKIWLFFVFGALFFGLLFGNLWLARKFTPGYEATGSESPVEESLQKFREGAGNWLNRGLLALSILISFIVGWISARQWENVLQYFNQTAVGKTDPIFHKDIGYYLFQYPLQRYFGGWLFTSLIFIILITAVIHFLYGAINVGAGKKQRFATNVKVHLSVLAAAALLVQAWRFRLDMFGRLYSVRGNITGANYTDVHATIPALWILLVACIIAAALFLLNIRYKGWRLPAVGLIGIAIIAMLALGLFPFIVQNYVVKPKELQRDSEYIGYHIEATQDGYRIQNQGEDQVISRREFPANQDLTSADITDNQATINNVRLWDPRLIQQVFNQRQVLRQEYSFDDVDVERYTVFNNVYTQMLVSGREMVVDQLSDQARTWQNEHLSYTHGYGAVMSPSNQLTTDGDPIFAIENIPPVSEENLGVEITRPEIYYGEQQGNYVVVRTGAQEIDYPIGNTNVPVEPYYEGSGGVQISDFLKRVAFTIRNRDVSLLFSGYVTNESRLMFRRNISDRVKMVAPFLKLDGDPYLIVRDDGTLMWIQDAYTTSSLYPYSERFNDEYNYIRNSVKVTIDAYNGAVTFYLADPGDPIAVTYSKIFPDLFTPFEEMPADIMKHIRYPEDLFSAQMEMYRTYHITDINAFYQKEDVWEVSTETYGAAGQPQAVQPYYVILKIPGEQKEEMVLMLPFNPRGKSNMVEWVAARCDMPNYGNLLDFAFPANKLVKGTQQFESLIDQQTQISEQITLWNQAGSRVTRGNTLVIPIEDSLIYVEPLYLEATNPAIPQLKRVIVGYGDQVEMQPTLQAALAAIFTSAPQPQPTPEPTPQPQPGAPTLEQLAQQANQLFNDAQTALRNGDFNAYAQKITQLGQVLSQMASLNQ